MVYEKSIHVDVVAMNTQTCTVQHGIGTDASPALDLGKPKMNDEEQHDVPCNDWKPKQ